MKFDFSGWATRNNLRCADGRTIMKDAFKSNDGQTVPLVWNHRHESPDNILGHALLENRDDGVYAYCTFNDSESGQNAKMLVQHGDVSSLSIYANQLKQQGGNVLHGAIREVSLVLAGANPGAVIDSVISHGEESDEEAIIYTDETIALYHASDDDDERKKKKKKTEEDTEEDTEEENNKEDKEDMAKEDDEKKEENSEDEETVQDVVDSMTDKQRNVMYALVGQAIEDTKNGKDYDEDEKPKKKREDEEEDEDMKHNVFDNDEGQEETFLSHSDQENIIRQAKDRSCGSLQTAIEMYANDHFAHGIDDIDTLFPDYKDVYPGAPELLERDQGWVTVVMNKVHKSPISRIRTRQGDIRDEDIRAYGYKKGNEKKETPNIKLLSRTTDPQTVYRKDKLDRDDIIDITDFDVVEYMRGIMRQNLNEEVATAAMIGDGREEGDADKIEEAHIRPIWTDDELYTIHTDVDIDAAKAELQGSNTSANFGENYIYAEAIITAALYSREDYKGKGTPDFYCTPHLLNVMMLARDLNGRRIYSNKSDLAAALDVGEIYTAEQFEGKTRKDADGNEHKLLGLFVNLDNYSFGSTKGGEITSFNQFDIDFNQEKYLIETRLSGALTRPFSAIALEEPVTSEVSPASVKATSSKSKSSD